MILATRVLLICACAAPLMVGCDSSDSQQGPTTEIVRGLKTHLVEERHDVTTRRYPSVLQPAEITTQSFEVSGQLMAVDLTIGQAVARDEVLAELDPRSLQLQVEGTQAGLEQAQSAADNASSSLGRQEELFKRGVVTKATVEKAQSDAEVSASQVVQAQKQLENAKDNLARTQILAPFDGYINSVEVESYVNVGPGTPIVTLYRSGGYEVSFSVSYDVVNAIAVGKRATIRLADDPSVVLAAHVTEVATRADTVSSFPIVVALEETSADLRAGMAVEVGIEFAVDGGEGLLVPLSVLALTGHDQPLGEAPKPGETREIFVFVYDSTNSTVRKRSVRVAGIRENDIIVVDGLAPGERVASAGVSFLHDGQRVRLLDSGT